MKLSRLIFFIICLISVASWVFFYFWPNPKQIEKKQIQYEEIDKESLKARLSLLSKDQLADMLLAGEEVLRWNRILQKAHSNVVKEVVSTQSKIKDYAHFPKGDIFDPDSQSLFYYHTHRENEHGHFHLFLHKRCFSDEMIPVVNHDDDNPLAHLIAISMDSDGRPLRLFTINKWVAKECWYKAEDLCQVLSRFKVEMPHPSWPLNQWVGAMVRLFQPQIHDLILQRDRKIQSCRDCNPEKDVWDDHKLEILSESSISIETQMQVLKELLQDSIPKAD